MSFIKKSIFGTFRDPWTELLAVLWIEEYSICTGIFYIKWGMHKNILCSMKNILCFYLHRIAARRVRAVTSRLVGPLFWWWQLYFLWKWRNCKLGASPFQIIIQSSYCEANSQSDKNRIWSLEERRCCQKLFTSQQIMKQWSTHFFLYCKSLLWLFSRTIPAKSWFLLLKCEH